MRGKTHLEREWHHPMCWGVDGMKGKEESQQRAGSAPFLPPRPLGREQPLPQAEQLRMPSQSRRTQTFQAMIASKLSSSCRFCCVVCHRYKSNGCSHAYRCGAPDTSQQSQGFILYGYTRVLMSLYAPNACGCPWRSEGVKSGVPGSSELTDMNAGNRSQNFCKSSMPFVQLGHLSIPEPTLFYFCFDN